MKKLAFILTFFLSLFQYGSAQLENPYSEFGLETVKLSTPREKEAFMLVVENSDKDSEISKIAISPSEKKCYSYDIDGELSEVSSLNHDQLGRFLSMDPLAPDYPWNSPYAFSENRVIDGVELEGLEYVSVNDSNISNQSKNEDGTYSLTIGGEDLSATGVETIDGQDYYNLGQNLYRTESGFSQTGNSEDVYSFAKVNVPDNRFSSNEISSLNSDCLANNSGDCWVTYKMVAARLTGNNQILNVEWSHGSVTNFLKNNGYFVDNNGDVVNHNTNRAANAGFDITITSVIANNLSSEPNGTYAFAVQVARQYHNVTVLANKNKSGIEFYAFDQSTGWLTNQPLMYSAGSLDGIFGDISLSRSDSRGSMGEEVHSRMYWYTSGKTRITLLRAEY